MTLRLEVVARHPVVASLLGEIFRKDPELGPLMVSATATNDPVALKPDAEPRLFILDAWSLHDQFTELARILRVRCPGSRFLALIGLEKSERDEMLRLLYAGIDGVVVVAAQWQEELLAAAKGIVEGKLWFPRQVIAEYVRNTNLLLDRQSRPELSLTARENQILQLMIRRFSNKEISGALGISERTVKFHVSNTLAKLRVQTRDRLFTAIDSTLHAVVPTPEKA